MALQVNGDPIRRVPALHGLLDSVPQVTGPDRWEMGVHITPDNCVEATVWDPVCGGTPTLPTSNGPGTPYDFGAPYVGTSFNCLSTTSADEIRERAERALEVTQGKAIEKEFWNGTILSSNPALSSASTIITGTFGLRAALVEMGRQMSNCGGGSQGVIHAPEWVVEMWMYTGMLIVEDGKRLVTRVRGDTVVAGVGYPGTGPSAAVPTAGSAYIYATGPVQYRLGPVEVIGVDGDVNRSDNQIRVRVQRVYNVNFDSCCHFGVIAVTGTA